ncbi:MAG: sugar phosphate isomerase/epimerase family protein [Oscillospiraceae bacterium]
MKIGVSTASLYPLHAEDAFLELCGLGVKNIEVFANSMYEGGEECTSKILKSKEEYGVDVTSFHPFSSPMESVFLFSNYDRRIDEMLEMYRGFFKSMNRLGAKVFVVHGAILSSKCSPEHYFKQFRLLAEVGREYAVTVAQENVSYCLSGNIDFLKAMKRELGEYANFVLDLKQARRSNADPLEYVNVLRESIVHCHLSDANGERDCLPLGKGNFNFPELVRRLCDSGFDGAMVVELYRHDYGDFSELRESADYIKEICEKIQ